MKNKIKDWHIELPQVYSRPKLDAMYRKIPLKDAVSRLLRKYFNAIANLYGIIPLQKAWEIISVQSSTLISQEEFLAFAEVARHECEDYCVLREDELYTGGEMREGMDWKIIAMYLLYDDSGTLYKIEAGQQGKPYFVPPKDELLAYDDISYCESMQKAEHLREFLSSRLQLEASVVEFMFRDILFFVRSDPGGFQTVVDRLKRVGADLDGKKLCDFATVYQDFSNDTRRRYNRGHTPDELIFMIGSKKKQFSESISFGTNIQMECWPSQVSGIGRL